MEERPSLDIKLDSKDSLRQYIEEHFEDFIIDTSSGDFYKRMMYKVH